MVTCPKCGTKNTDDSKFCVNCGASLYMTESPRERGSTCFGSPRRGIQDECFGLPNGGAIAGIIFGVLLLISGLGNLFHWSIDLGAFFMIIIGSLIIAAAIYGLMRRSR